MNERLNKLNSINFNGKARKKLQLPNEGTSGMMLGDTGSNFKSDSGNVAPTNCTTIIYALPEEDRVIVGYLNEWINAYSFISSKCFRDKHTNNRDSINLKSYLAGGRCSTLLSPQRENCNIERIFV